MAIVVARESNPKEVQTPTMNSECRIRLMEAILEGLPGQNPSRYKRNQLHVRFSRNKRLRNKQTSVLGSSRSLNHFGTNFDQSRDELGVLPTENQPIVPP